MYKTSYGKTAYVCVLDSLRSYGLQPSRLLCSMDSSGKNTAVGSQALFQGTRPKNQTWVLHLISPALVGRFFTPSTWEAPGTHGFHSNLEFLKMISLYKQNDHIVNSDFLLFFSSASITHTCYIPILYIMIYSDHSQVFHNLYL